MKRIRFALCTLLVLTLCLSGCGLFSAQAPATPNLTAPTAAVTEVGGETGADAVRPAATWATGSKELEVATGVEYAASRGLLSAVSVYCTFAEETAGSYSYGFGFPVNPYSGQGETQEQEVTSAGSGVIYWLDRSAGDAYILTNYHVVFDVNSVTENHISDNISLFLYGSERADMAIPATYVGGSMYYDLAVLKVKDSAVLRESSAEPAAFADSDNVCAGQTAIAVGNPEAAGISVSSGVVSVDSEYIQMTAVDEATQLTLRVIRVDTAVNSGNSGGGLYDDTGCLIGLVNAKISDSQVENIGYAIPGNIVRAIADNILTNCDGLTRTTVQRGLLGITVTTNASRAVYDEATRKTRIVETVYVDTVNADGAAAGLLQEGDTLTAIDVDGVSTQIHRQYDVVDAMLAATQGSQVRLTLLRDGAEQTVVIPITADDVASY